MRRVRDRFVEPNQLFREPRPSIALVCGEGLKKGEGRSIVVMKLAQIGRNTIEVRNVREKAAYLDIRIFAGFQPPEEFENRFLIEEKTGIGLLRRANARLCSGEAGGIEYG